jgi:broad specificity phosphatase PhoE
MMRELIIVVAVAVLAGVAAWFFAIDRHIEIIGADTTTIILVRHAERSEEGDDPSLTEAGQQRAIALTERLSDIQLAAVYSTPFSRTRETALPTAESQGLDVQMYDVRSLAELEVFVNQLANDYRGQTVLVVGHSNTTPFLIRMLEGGTVDETVAIIDEDDYDNIYTVVVTDIGQVAINEDVYGVSTSGE